MGPRVVRMPARRQGKSLARMLAQADRDMRVLSLSYASLPRRPATPVFVTGRANRCPDCHGEAFSVGRVTAECAGCGLPLAIVTSRRVM